MDNKTIDEKKIIDIDYDEVSDKQINGKPIFYTTKQVAEILEEPSSKIRYWCDCFNDYLQIQRAGQNRQFTEQNIEQLKYIRKLLKEDKLTIKQVQEYCSEKDTDNFLQNIQQNDPIAIETLASALMMKVNENMNAFKAQLTQEIVSEVTNNLTSALTTHAKSLDSTKAELKDYIAVTIEDKLQSNKKDIASCIENAEGKFSESQKHRDVELVETLKKHMEERRKESEEETKNKKGFFSRLFKR